MFIETMNRLDLTCSENKKKMPSVSETWWRLGGCATDFTNRTLPEIVHSFSRIQASAYINYMFRWQDVFWKERSEP